MEEHENLNENLEESSKQLNDEQNDSTVVEDDLNKENDHCNHNNKQHCGHEGESHCNHHEKCGHGGCEKHQDKNKHSNEKHYEKEIAKLREEIEQKEKELEESKIKASQYLNTASYYKNEAETNKKDFDRFKERNKNIETEAKIKANELVAKKLLPIIDNFDQAMLSLQPEVMRGFVMIYSSLTETLKDLGVAEIICLGEELDPEKHNCIDTVETEDESLDGHIAKIYQKGYKFVGDEKIIRPATVSVYKVKN